jgi:hypothetical protein
MNFCCSFADAEGSIVGGFYEVLGGFGGMRGAFAHCACVPKGPVQAAVDAWGSLVVAMNRYIVQCAHSPLLNSHARTVNNSPLKDLHHPRYRIIPHFLQQNRLRIISHVKRRPHQTYRFIVSAQSEYQAS